MRSKTVRAQMKGQCLELVCISRGIKDLLQKLDEWEQAPKRAWWYETCMCQALTENAGCEVQSGQKIARD